MSQVWSAEADLIELFSLVVNAEYNFHSVYSLLEQKCPYLKLYDHFYSFVFNLTLFSFYECGDLFSHTSIALGAVLLYLECNQLEDLLSSFRLLINQNLHLFG